MVKRMRWLRQLDAQRPLYYRSFCVLAIFFGLVTVSYAVAYAQQPSPEFDLSQVPVPGTPPLALVGQPIYQENCAPCHGVQGMGDGPTAADLPGPATAFADPDAVWERSPAQLFHTTKFGRLEKLMPPWQNQLDDSQIWQAVAYAWSLHTTPTDVEGGAELYAQSCATCHGDQGAGNGPEATPDLVDFTDLSYAMAQSQADWQAGWQAAHPEIGADWTPTQQRNVLEYIRSFTYTPPWESAYRAGSGAITGTVTQGTAGGPAVAGLTATLEAYINFTPVAVFTATVDSDGGFAFGELGNDPGIDYLVSVAAEDIRYTSPILNFTPDQQTLQTQVAIYGTTEDASAIQIDRLHWIIDTRPGVIVVGEILSFGNSGDRTFAGQSVEGVDSPVTVGLHVPAAAQELTFENGALGGVSSR
ncbi:MAG: c-type cytochrome [Caldilineaceae bacterium]